MDAVPVALPVADSLRVLFLGENWYGSCARACCYALRRLGHDVRDIDAQTIVPQWRRPSSRAGLRLFRWRVVHEYNDRVLDAAMSFRPDLLLGFKAPYARAATLRRLRDMGIALYNYYPDTSVFVHGSLIPEALAEYDCVFYTKHFFERDVRGRISLRDAVFLPHGYDPELHRPSPLTERDLGQYGRDVSVIATRTAYKEQVLDQLVAAMPHIDLRIWGDQWRERCRSSRLRPYIAGTALAGSGYAKALAAARINLAIMSGPVMWASQGDETTTRTYEIPACGGFMLHERTEEVCDLYEEGKEVACFGSVDELAEKIDYYLARPDERTAIACAGRARCVPAYSYSNRMAALLQWHEERRRRGRG